MAKKINTRKVLSLLLTLVMILSLTSITVWAANISVSSKVEVSGRSSISISGYNAVIIKQSQNSIIWVGGDHAGSSVAAAVAAKDPSVGTYAVVSGSGPFHFASYWSGNQYQNTSFSVSGGVDEDADVEIMRNAYDDIQRELCFRMYYYGAIFGK